MKLMNFKIFALIVAVTVVGSLSAAEGDEGKRRAPGTPGGMAGIFLKNADALGLSAEQKAKLEEMAKGPMAVLTDEQKIKARELVQATRVPPGDGQGRPMRKKEGDAEKKPDEKKPDEKKPE